MACATSHKRESVPRAAESGNQHAILLFLLGGSNTIPVIFFSKTETDIEPPDSHSSSLQRARWRRHGACYCYCLCEKDTRGRLTSNPHIDAGKVVVQGRRLVLRLRTSGKTLLYDIDASARARPLQVAVSSTRGPRSLLKPGMCTRTETAE